MNKPSLHKSFESGLLFAIFGGNDDKMLLQVCSDFDVTKRQLDAQFGRSQALMGPFEDADINTERARTWSMTSEKMHEKAFANYFRQFKKPEEVVKKPTISKLVLMPCVLDQPFVPNDLGDR